jgi:nicotinamide riboside transporter PnuC
MFIATGLSLIGGALMMMRYALEAHYVWLVGDIIWLAYFRKKKDYWGQILFSIYLVEILIGIWMWS